MFYMYKSKQAYNERRNKKVAFTQDSKHEFLRVSKIICVYYGRVW